MMTFNDAQILDAVNSYLNQARVSPGERVRWLRTHHHTPALRGMQPLVDRYLQITDPPRSCQVTHDHWEGPMICGNMLPCPRHG